MQNFSNLTPLIPTEFSAAIIVLNIVFACILQLGIVWVYKRTHRGLSYSPSFIFTLILVGVLGTVIMMIVRNNIIGAVALLGAFSLIRFRTILKETRDVAFLFFSLAAGVAVGTGNYAVALISTVSVSLIILALDWYKIGSLTNNAGFILTFDAKESLDMEVVKAALTRHSDSFNLLQTRAHGVGIESYVFLINFKDAFKAADIVKTLKGNPAIMDVELVTGERSVEY